MAPTSTQAPSELSAGEQIEDRCRSADLRLTVEAHRVSPPTGQHPVPLTLTNVSTRSCSLLGYPHVALLDAAGQELPFRYAQSGDQVVTPHPPVRVDLPPGGAAHVTINKYRCDFGDRAMAKTVQLVPPGEVLPLQVSLAGPAFLLGYCGPGDPGAFVSISPVAATLSETLAR